MIKQIKRREPGKPAFPSRPRLVLVPPAPALNRSIRFPQRLWDAIDAEAQRCQRSSEKQVEAILATYYELEDVELSQEAKEMLRELNRRRATTRSTDTPDAA